MTEIDEIFQNLKKLHKIFLTLYTSIVFFYFSKMQIILLEKLIIFGATTLFIAFLLKFKSVFLNCNNKCYSLKCHKRKMIILQKLNNRLFEKVIKEDDKIEKNKFFKSKSYYVYMGIMKFFCLIPVVFLRVILTNFI
jgi:hypothetical protein